MAKVIVGMSGGVDSAVCAYLLKEAGHDVTGVMLRTWMASDGTEGRCCEIDDARAVARKLGIPFHPYSCLSDFEKYVTTPFIHDYICGKTPNPCVVCNRQVKWEKMLYMAQVLQADYVATGHYASVVQLDNGRYTVKKAVHAQKDQTYMLYRLSQQQLAATLMPLGELTKTEVRSIADQAGLPVASKQDSQEICFVPDGSYADYIEKNADLPIPGEGDFVDEEGKKLGRHKGIIHYTVGQRKGLGIALGYPAYVKEIRPDRNEVVLGSNQSLYKSEILCDHVNYMGIPGLDGGQKLECRVKVRYHHPPQKAVLEGISPDRVKVTFHDAVRAPAPGQSAVFYDAEECVLGGGVIAPCHTAHGSAKE